MQTYTYRKQNEANEIIAELKAENDRLKKDKVGLHSEIKQLEQENLELKENFEGQRNAYKKLNSMYEGNCEYTGKLEQTLQEIKVIAEELLEKGLEPQSVEHQLRLKGKRELSSIILDLITKAEEE